jgi:hypothetical protein
MCFLQKSRASFREEVERALLLGVDYLVVHPGSARGACEADGIALCAKSLKIACKGLKFGSLRILLEMDEKYFPEKDRKEVAASLGRDDWTKRYGREQISRRSWRF